jgi:diguanylate cyclase (GGDEF)-like protein
MQHTGASEVLAGRRIQILMVEDSEDDAFLLYSELSNRGATVDYRRVDSPADMTAALAERTWDVVICDHNMPGFDSFGALEILKESGKDIPFIIYSAQLSESAGHRAMQAGVHDFVHKGNLGRLVPVLERELRGAAARSAARQADTRIKRLAFYDPVSSLPNRNLFRSRVDDWLAECVAQRGAAHGAMFCIDIDRFLRINGSFGYEAGNGVLREIADRLKECVEDNGIVARLGADDFGIFFPQLSRPDDAMSYGQWVLGAFDAPFVRDSVELYLTPSVGIALAPEAGADAYELMTGAETAMTLAKRAGGNGFRIYSREQNVSSVERLTLEMDLRHAVARDQLLLHYQPVHCAGTRAVASVEALIRWKHPKRGLVPPDRFIPLADESGLIVDIGEWAMRQACAQAREWKKFNGAAPGVSVNVSAVQFGQPRLLQRVKEAIDASGIDPQRLCLEITESVLMRDAESAIGMLRALKNMGVRIAVDDFGTGYSSLAYLKRFPIDILKIDRAFVRDLAENEKDAAIVRAIIGLAKNLRLMTVAEGVESERQIDFLDAHECDFLQGYYFSRAIDAATLEERLGAAPVAEAAINR